MPQKFLGGLSSLRPLEFRLTSTLTMSRTAATAELTAAPASPLYVRISARCPSCGHDDITENELLGYIQCTCYKCGWGQWPCMEGKMEFYRGRDPIPNSRRYPDFLRLLTFRPSLSLSSMSIIISCTNGEAHRSPRSIASLFCWDLVDTFRNPKFERTSANASVSKT
eukprot:g40402.t1